MDNVYAVKLFRGDGEALVTAEGQEYRITIADLERSGIKDGDATDCEITEFLCAAAEKLSCIKKSLVYLSYRALPVRKLCQKLKKAGFGDTAVASATELLIKKGYLDDESLCAEYARSLQKSKLFGISRIRKELYVKGFDRECVENALELLEEELAAEDEDVTAMAIKALLAKKFPSLSSEDRQTRGKAVAYLYRHGYTYDDINNAIEQLTE